MALKASNEHAEWGKAGGMKAEKEMGVKGQISFSKRYKYRIAIASVLELEVLL